MKVAINIRLYEHRHEQVKVRKKGWNNKEIFIENKYAIRRLKKRGVVIPCHARLWVKPEKYNWIYQGSVMVRSHAAIFLWFFCPTLFRTHIVSCERKIRKPFENRLEFYFHPTVWERFSSANCEQIL